MSIITFEHSFFAYPQQIKDLISEGLVDFGAWYLMNDEQTSRRFEGLKFTILMIKRGDSLFFLSLQNLHKTYMFQNIWGINLLGENRL